MAAAAALGTDESSTPLRQEESRQQGRGTICRRRQKQQAPAVVREEFVVKCPHGEVCVAVLRPPGEGPFPAAVVSAACYCSLPAEMEKTEGALFVKHGYAYVVSWQQGPMEEIADQIFKRFRSDAGAVLDWLGTQAWFDGRLGTHGMSLVGNMSYATITAATDPDAPADRPKVLAAACSISFTRIWPTLFLWGHGFAAELAARFLWIAEKGMSRHRTPGHLWGLACFFGLREWPGLWRISLRRPATDMDKELWGRSNALWQAGILQQQEGDKFWREGVDEQCDLAALGERCPPLHVISGWNDVFVRQAIEDFRAAQRSAPDLAQLTVARGGHFGVAHGYGKLILHETLATYEEHVRGVSRSEARSRMKLHERKAVRLEMLGAPPGQQWLECDTWPPKPSGVLGCFMGAGGAQGSEGSLTFEAPEEPGSLEYEYDPRDPTPYEGNGWLNLRKEGQSNQAVIEARSDVLVCSTPPLKEPLDVVGDVRATLFVSSTAPECDFLVRLCVVGAAAAPSRLRRALSCTTLLTEQAEDDSEGRSLNIVEGISRVHFGGGSPGASGREGQEVCSVEVNLGPIAYHFKRGERIRIQVCSAAHPRAFRHPLAADDWLAGGGEHGAPARQAVHFGDGALSALWLPLRGPELTVVRRLSRFECPTARDEKDELHGAMPGLSRMGSMSSV